MSEEQAQLLASIQNETNFQFEAIRRILAGQHMAAGIQATTAIFDWLHRQCATPEQRKDVAAALRRAADAMEIEAVQ